MVSNKVLTLAFVRESTRVLLGLKKRGFGEGRWNGFGGKVQIGETIEAGAVRELEEECGLVAKELNPAGVLLFEMGKDPQLLEVHVFTTRKYSGTVTESEEMKPQWYEEEKVPLESMWPDDELWFPHMLRGTLFYGYFIFKGMNDIVDYKLHTVKSLKGLNIPAAPLGNCDLFKCQNVL